MSYTCDDCTDHDGKLQPLLVYRGGFAPWLKDKAYFCPQCGQIFIKGYDKDAVKSITLDEYEPKNLN